MRGYLLTGCSRGLGLAMTRQLLAEGATVVGIARQAPAEPLPGHFVFVAADLSQPDEVAGLMPRLLAALGDGPFSSLSLINNAGVVTPMALAGHYPAQAVIDAFNINLLSAVLLTNAFLASAARLTQDLRVLNISSGAAAHAYPGWGIYGASKAGLDHFSRHAALEQAAQPNGARVVSLYPGVIDTEMQARIRASDPQDFPQRDRFDALKAEGGLSGPAQAAARILHYLHHADFGREPVIDIRNLSISADAS
ncbi:MULTISPECIES: SDR family NAD(P)-dependent oxidoreductase [unclassified Paludibacterium]|uniref:SDR family NAD(P)-dependent oxidoreductase n=1 Tax=unclassified Paludibacterium TaxID=2618429 RepID=UPI001C0599E7|nr:SDR family NAD(P)-dependent oxidoreductase [Paludibacterium sp. B53371]BEV71215.1 SDR family oxidoreductase [Paludibacterium sp. THUN1379]